MFIRGLGIVLASGFVAFLVSAYGLEAARFSPQAVIALRFLAWGVVVGLTIQFLIRPLFRPITEEQVALYLEEHEPSLEASMLGALEMERVQDRDAALPSRALVDKLVDRAVDKARAVEYGRGIDRKSLYQGSGALGFIIVAVVLFLLLGPSSLRHGMQALVVPTQGVAEVNPYSILVEPGNAVVSRGSDLGIEASLGGFTTDEAYLFSRLAGEETFQRLSMIQADSLGFELLLLNLTEDTEYFVEANGIRSATHLIEVEALPYVEAMTHTYVFPSYTGLEPRVEEAAGDIAVLAGTLVRLSIASTLPTPGGLALVNGTDSIQLEAGPDGLLEGEFRVRGDGFYRIDLARTEGALVQASPEYTIDVLEDLGPSVVISDPGRDSQASAIEEVFVEVQADDDFGIGSLDLIYSINGSPEDTVPLFNGGGRPLPEVTAGHTLFLEEWELEPGDVISYYASARDNRSGSGAVEMSDIYFINVRPFRRDFRQADQQPPGGGENAGGPQGASGGSLSELQRDVVAATFNLLRDRGRTAPETFTENTVSVALAQGRVRDEVANLLVQMNARGISQSNEQFQEIAELLPSAVSDMESAEDLLRAEDVENALAPEQRALRFLQKAEETYERTVGQQQGGSGGGGGGGGASAEELADLFELELDKLQNQYETVQRGERQQANEEVDELMERLKELARRQQQELERQRRQGEAQGENQQGARGGAGGQSQRELADEVEETARQLKELSRRTGDAELDRAARRLEQAAETMRRSASNSGQSRGLAGASSALDELEEAQRRLERNQDDRVENDILDALDRVDRLAEWQSEIRDDVADLPEDPSARRPDVQEIQAQKDQMVRETQALKRDLARLQQVAGTESPEAAEELGEAVESLRENMVEERLAFSKGTIEQRDLPTALDQEDQIANDLEDVRQEVQDALSAFRMGRPDDAMEEALDEARELSRGAESLGRRLDQRARESGVEEGRNAGEGQRGQAQGGQRGGDPTQQGGENPTQADASAAGGGDGAARGTPEPFSPEEIRQFAREFAQRLSQAQDLREALEESGRESPELEEAIDALQALQDPDVYGDLPQVDALRRQLEENLRRLEFMLRRDVEGETEGQAAITGSEDVPEGFRRMVEEYFRNLARTGGGGGG
jgi:hypothetical protein